MLWIAHKICTQLIFLLGKSFRKVDDFKKIVQHFFLILGNFQILHKISQFVLIFYVEAGIL